MTEQFLWDVVQKNAGHIEKINRELGGLLSSMEWVRTLLTWQFTFVGLIFIGVLVNIIMTRRNGRR